MMVLDKMEDIHNKHGLSYILVILFVATSTVVVSSQRSQTTSQHCPSDYRYRVETCIMEAQVAPQAGGGLPLITQRDKLEELCSRGILQKTINCLRDIYNRCSENATHRHELDMLFSVEDWRRGRDLLCEDLNRKLVFKDHFDCLSTYANRISSCILIRTQLFRQSVTQAREHKTLHEITCNFAENIVTCLERPLAKSCPIKVVEVLTSALHRFLPPACAPVPAVYERADSHNGEKGGENMIYETVIVEGDGAEN